MHVYTPRPFSVLLLTVASLFKHMLFMGRLDSRPQQGVGRKGRRMGSSKAWECRVATQTGRSFGSRLLAKMFGAPRNRGGELI